MITKRFGRPRTNYGISDAELVALKEQYSYNALQEYLKGRGINMHISTLTARILKFKRECEKQAA